MQARVLHKALLQGEELICEALPASEFWSHCHHSCIHPCPHQLTVECCWCCNFHGILTIEGTISKMHLKTVSECQSCWNMTILMKMTHAYLEKETNNGQLSEGFAYVFKTENIPDYTGFSILNLSAYKLFLLHLLK